MTTTMALADLMREWKSGEDDSLSDEVARLEADPVHVAILEPLEQSVRTEGIREPILLGSDGRIWDGHHRIAVALRLDLTSVPVINASDL